MKKAISLGARLRRSDIREAASHCSYIVKTVVQSIPSLLTRALGQGRITSTTTRQQDRMLREAQLAGESMGSYVKGIANELHYRTPKGLKYLRDSCPRCSELPEDCKFVDYTIFNVRKAEKSLKRHHRYIQKAVIEELEMINPELAYHLRERISG